MLRLLPERTQDIKQFRSAPWPFQQTFKTPLKDLNRFVSTFLSQYPVQSGTVSTDEVVFEPRTVLSLIRRHSVPLDGWYEFTLTAEGQQDVAELIEAVLADWIDFVFVPFPTQFAIYADHDEFTTFYAPSVDDLVNLTKLLMEAGFDRVAEYRRESRGDKWR